MAQANRIRIRPFSLIDPNSRTNSGEPHLSIEINGRILPLAKFVEIVGEIVPQKPETTASGDAT